MLEKSVLNPRQTIDFQMNVGQLIRKKRDGEELTKEEMYCLVKDLVAGNVADAQIGALLMAMYIQGVSDFEAVQLTQAIVMSGDRLEWPPAWQSVMVDKHSTGGVGDKISLVLAPVMAACGLKVPMISGRSLEHTGGTLDKLESIPGFIVDLSQEMMVKALEHAGCFIMAATRRLCLADKMLYRVRDVTCTVDCTNLIVPSIISKKVAGGAKFLVVDIKVGKAAFYKTVESAKALAERMISVSEELGVCARVVLSRMDEPLGNAAGNALEVAETVKCLSGNMPQSVARLITALGSNLLEMTNYEGDAEQLIHKVIQDGSAMEHFRRMLLAQGVNEETVLSLVQGKPVLPSAKYTTEFKASISGWVSEVDAWILGQVCLSMGTGRRTVTDTVDPAVGIVINKHVGDTVVQGEVWLTVHHNSTLSQNIVEYLDQAITIVSARVESPDVIIEVIQ